MELSDYQKDILDEIKKQLDITIRNGIKPTTLILGEDYYVDMCDEGTEFCDEYTSYTDDHRHLTYFTGIDLKIISDDDNFTSVYVCGTELLSKSLTVDPANSVKKEQNGVELKEGVDIISEEELIAALKETDSDFHLIENAIYHGDSILSSTGGPMPFNSKANTREAMLQTWCDDFIQIAHSKNLVA